MTRTSLPVERGQGHEGGQDLRRQDVGVGVEEAAADLEVMLHDAWGHSFSWSRMQSVGQAHSAVATCDRDHAGRSTTLTHDVAVRPGTGAASSRRSSVGRAVSGSWCIVDLLLLGA
jgi:hypothetical protein